MRSICSIGWASRAAVRRLPLYRSTSSDDKKSHLYKRSGDAFKIVRVRSSGEKIQKSWRKRHVRRAVLKGLAASSLLHGYSRFAKAQEVLKIGVLHTDDLGRI